MSTRGSIITRTVWVLSFVSLLADVASEMLYPVMPVYLKSIGFSVVFIGVLEGFAEAVAGMSKGYFGKLSDSRGTRLPFVRWGYLLSALSKPMMAVLTFPLWIFSARTLDRTGKGLRTGARDALLSDESTPETKGKVFGFHRSLDTVGAAIGPAVALLFLYYHPGQYRLLFYIAFIPGLLSVGLTFFIREKKTHPAPARTRVGFFSFLKYWKHSPPLYRKVVAGLLLFALFNSSDVFLLLRMKESGMSDTATIGLYIFYNLVYALCAYPIGSLADKVGLRGIFISGLAVFAVVYFGMSIATNLYVFLALFALYGIYAAATEGVAKAWISNITGKGETATAIGTYSGLQSICAMLASAIAGLVWYHYGAAATFALTGGIALFVIGYFLVFTRPRIL